jgi:hypothetical protein
MVPKKSRLFKYAGLWLLATENSLYYFDSFSHAREYLCNRWIRKVVL